jgi:hypothetical protein
MKKLAIIAALAFAAPPAFADSQICIDAGHLWTGIITGKQSGVAKSAQELLARNLDTMLNQMAALTIIEKVYADPYYDKVSPEIFGGIMRAFCEGKENAHAARK